MDRRLSTSAPSATPPEKRSGPDHAEPFAARSAAGGTEGTNAADWWLQETLGARATGDLTTLIPKLLSGLEGMDPAVLDTLPQPDLSDSHLCEICGQHSPHHSPRWNQLTTRQRLRTRETYLDAFHTAAHETIIRSRHDLLPPPQPEHPAAVADHPSDTKE